MAPPILPPPIGPNPVAQPSSARTGHSFALPRKRLEAIWTDGPLPRLSALLKPSADQALERAESNRLCADLIGKAHAANWSRRKLAGIVGIPWTTWRRLSGGSPKPSLIARFLPALRAAAARLGS